MKCLSVREPWATLIVHYDKNVENRTWYTEYRGPLVICASASPMPQDDVGWDCLSDRHMEDLGESGRKHPVFANPGHALGIVTLTDIDEEMLSEYDALGQYHWRLDPKTKLVFREPVPLKGRLGLFNPPTEYAAAWKAL